MITKEKINQIKDFIENMPEIENSLREVLVDYLKIFVENVNLKNELATSKEHILHLLKELENQDIKIVETQEELDSLKMVH
jgi:hypothetical protein